MLVWRPAGRKAQESAVPGLPRARAEEEVRWQRILDMLDPGKNCGAWAPATVAERPVVCTRAPHDVREEHVNAETGCHWSENPEFIPD
jgi:hypothetical protein